MSTLRAPTAFELFLQRRQQAAAEGRGGSERQWSRLGVASAPDDLARELLPLPAPPAAAVAAAPPAAASKPPRLSLGALRAVHGPQVGESAAERLPIRHSLHRSAPDLVPQVVASLPSPRLAGSNGSGAVAISGGGGGGGGTTAVYGELASAAASLASAAHKLARGSAADRSVAASYETLAQAAADLAASACMIRPLTSSASGGGGAFGGGGRLPFASTSASRPSDATSTASSALPRAVDPMASAAAANAANAASAATEGSCGARPAPQHQSQHRQVPPSRLGTGSSPARARVSAPRFPGYNPLIHLVESGLPPPDSAGATRPTTSSPITHQLGDSRAALQPSGAGNASATSYLSRSRRRRRSSNSGLGPRPGFSLGRSSGDGGEPMLLHPADLSRLPVLSIGLDGQPLYTHQQSGFGEAAAGGSRDVWYNAACQTAPGGTGGGGGGAEGGRWTRTLGGGSGGQMAEPNSLPPTCAYVRMSDGAPPTEVVNTADVEQDEVDMRYNKVLAALRERVYSRGPGRLAAAFRDLDREGCGLVSRREFTAVLQSLNLGAAGLVDDKVVELMLASVEGGAAAGGGGGGVRAARGQPAAAPPGPGQRVAYRDFVNALRFGALPWRGSNRKLRHRMGGDPDQPIGPPLMAGTPPPYSFMYGNTATGEAAPGGGRGAGGFPKDLPPPLSPPPPPPPLAAAAAGAAAAGAGGRMGDLRLAFRSVDHNCDGVVEWSEFREALRRVGEQNRLQLTDQALMQIYQDADPDLSTGVDYEAFMAAYGSGGGAVAAATTGRQPDGALTSYGAGSDGAAGGHPGGRPAPWSCGAQWRPHDLPRAPAATPLTTSYNHAPLGGEPWYTDGAAGAAGERLGYGAGAGFGFSSGGGEARAGGVGAGGGSSWDPWWRTAPGWGDAAVNPRPDAFREMRAGAAVMLRRLGSSAGRGVRASARA